MSVKNTMFNILKLAVAKTDGIFGVEIEAEGRNLPRDLMNWRTENDLSLKSGEPDKFEYVMPAPLDLDGTHNMLMELKDAYKKNASKVKETDTSGVHVHINVQDYTPKELFTFMVTYLTLEELVLTFCGEMREGNHFCLRVKDAEFILHEFVKAAEQRQFAHLKNDNIRYASMNPCSLFKYGSLEFRAMRGTGDIDAIYEWVEILNEIRLAAKRFKSPDEVVVSISAEGEENFIRQVLGNKAGLFLKVKNAKNMVREGARRVQPLAFIPDWDAFKDTKTNPFA